MADRDEFYDPEDEENASPPDSPEEPDLGDERLENRLQEEMASAKAQSETPEQPEPAQIEQPELGETLQQQHDAYTIPDEQQFESQGEDAEAEGAAAADAAHVIPEVDDLQPPESLADYLEQHPEIEDDEGGLPDSSKQFLKHDNEGDIPEWRTLFATDRALSSTMKDLLIDHEQSINDINRSLESSRW